MTQLPDLRQQLADARDELRRAKDHYETIRAIVEMGVMTTGKNAEDRKRELTVALSRDATHEGALELLRTAERHVDRVQAAIDVAEDERREREWAIRARLADALGDAGHEDQAFEITSDRRLSVAVASRYETANGARRHISSTARVAPLDDDASLDDLYPTR